MTDDQLRELGFEQCGKHHTQDCIDAANAAEDWWREPCLVGDREGGCICDGYPVYRKVAKHET